MRGHLFEKGEYTVVVSPEQLLKILTGNYSFSMLGFSMLITRLKGIYNKNPSPDTLKTCASEVNVFISKYKSIMGSDCMIIEKI